MYIATGRVVRAHGTSGHVKVVAYSGIPERYLDLKTVYVDLKGTPTGMIIEAVEVNEAGATIKFRGIDSREAAQALLKCELLVAKENRIRLEADDYFIHDLLGLKVFDIEGHHLGTLEEVLAQAGNDVYVVRGEEREILIPAVKEFIRAVDLEAGRMEVQLIEGM